MQYQNVQFLKLQPPPELNFEAPQFQNMDAINQRQSLAQAIAGQAMNGGPARGGIGEVLSRLGQAAIARIMMDRADKQAADARSQNADALRMGLEKGDIAGLLTSGNDLAEKLGAGLLEKQMAPKTSYRTLTPDEVAKAGYPAGAVVQEDSNGRQYLTARPPNNAGLPGGYRWNADHTGWEAIPGGPADPTAAGKLAAARRAPPKANPAIGGDEPWNQKW